MRIIDLLAEAKSDADVIKRATLAGLIEMALAEASNVFTEEVLRQSSPQP